MNESNRTAPPAPGPIAAAVFYGLSVLLFPVSFVPKTFQYPFEGDVPKQYEASARQTFFDGVVDRCLADIGQFVILGE